MSAPAITTAFANPDPNTTVASLQDLVTQLNLLVTSSIQGTFVPYVLSSSTPAVSDQDKSWLKLDSAGRPLGVYIFYNGNWRKFYNGSIGEVKLFIGDPNQYFDANGLGKVGDEWDGWQLMTTLGSTSSNITAGTSDDWSDLFVVGGSTYDSGGGVWQSSVTGTAKSTRDSGGGTGSANFTIQNTNLPNMTVQLSGRVGYDDNASGSGQDPAAIVTKKWYGGPTPSPVPVAATFGANPNGTPAVPQVPIPTVPPFAVAAYVKFVGYA